MSFKGINLSEQMIKSLNRQGFTNPSEIQLRAIPKALKGETLMVQSATGTGKTLAFLVPIIEKIDFKNQSIQAIIIAPTRELAQQIYDFAIPFVKEFPTLKIKLFKSGIEREESLQGLSIPPHIAIGTPGRLLDILVGKVSLKSVNTIVLDEADMLLTEGFFGEIDKIVEQTNKPRFLVYSATLESNLTHELERYIGPNIPVINEETMTASNVTHYLIDIRHNDVLASLISVIEAIKPYLLLVFASKKETANELYAGLRAKKYKAALLTGDLDARERKSIIRRVKDGEFYILVCSDMAARGLDIPDVSDVINVDLPNNLEFYYHRAGRTGRFNKTGNCYTFYNNDKTAKPLALIQNGVKFKYLVLRDNELVAGKGIEKTHPTKRKVDEELQSKIRQVKAQTRSKDKKVKPGYKKKQKAAIEKVKQKHRREIIRKDIRRQRVERYKRENQNG